MVEDFFRQVCVYQYNENQDVETADFKPSSLSPIVEELKKFGPVHVNLMDQPYDRDVLAKLEPYAPWIYALSLEGNFLPNAALEDLSKF